MKVILTFIFGLGLMLFEQIERERLEKATF